MFRTMGTLSLMTITGLATSGGSAWACDRFSPRVVVHRPVSVVSSIPVQPEMYCFKSKPEPDVVRISLSAPVRYQAPLPEVPAGAGLRLSGQLLGAESGTVAFVVGGISLECEVHSWSNRLIELILPQVSVEEKTVATLRVFRADGSLAKETRLALVPTEELEVVTADP